MKSLRYLAVILMFSSTSFAAPPDGGQPPVSQEDAQKLRGQVDALGQLFGVQQQQQVKPTPKQEQHKTPADVADRALTLFSSAVAQVAASIEKVAPELFRVMVRQQYAKAASNLISPLGAIIITLIAGWFLRRIWSQPDIYADEYAYYIAFAKVIPVGLALCFGIWFVSNLSDSAAYLLNPEYYAIRDLVTMVLNPGAVQ